MTLDNKIDGAVLVLVREPIIYELGNRQWDIPALRTLLETILPENNQFQDFEVVHDFPRIGSRTMLHGLEVIERNARAQHQLIADYWTSRALSQVSLGLSRE